MAKGHAIAKCISLLAAALSVFPQFAFAQKEIAPAAAAIATDIASMSKRSVGVIDFVNLQGATSELGRFVAEEMALGIITARKGLTVVERNQLRAVMQEIKRGEQGIVDPAMAKQLGKILGVDVLVIGTMTDIGESVHIVVKAIDAGNAQIVAATSFDLARTPAIVEISKNSLSTGSTSSASGEPSRVSTGVMAGEITVPSSGTSYGASALQSSTPSEPVYRSGALQVSATSLALSSNGRRAVLNLTIENLLAETVMIAVPRQTTDCVPGNIYPTRGIFTPQPCPAPPPAMSLSDNRGNSWSPVSLRGVSLIETNSFTTIGSFSSISPHQRANLVATFATEGNAGTEVTFSMELETKSNQGRQPNSIVITGIKARR